MKTLKLSGDTYNLRRDIRGIGGVWNYDEKGWLIPETKEYEAKKFAEDHRLDVDYVEASEDTFAPLEGEKLRAYRQQKASRKAERLLLWAEKRETKSDELLHKHDRYTTDYSFVTQPILVGHHSEKRHRKLLNRIHTDIDNGYNLQDEAHNLRERAERLTTGVRVKGDAAKAQAEKTAYIRSRIKVGDRVQCWITGWGVIEKINQKTYKTEGSTYLKQIRFIKLEEGQ